jgi:ABC-2 type transport system ATP-binding protein
MKAIQVENLTKKFDDVVAVDNVTFDVAKGELFGLLGPNGAGKTTTINMLSTLLKKTSGSGKVAGYDISKNKNDVRRSIGVVFQEPALDSKLTGRENLEFHSMMYGIGKEDRIERIRKVLNLVDLSDKEKILVEKYSGGMKRRLEIARGLIHRPKVLFLDEPTLGLDAQTRRHIWDYIKKLNKETDVTIILTTHYMEEADFLCTRIAIMDQGKFVAMDSPSKLKDILAARTNARLKEIQSEVFRVILDWYRDILMLVSKVDDGHLIFADDKSALVEQSKQHTQSSALQGTQVVEGMARRLDRNIPDTQIFDEAFRKLIR